MDNTFGIGAEIASGSYSIEGIFVLALVGGFALGLAFFATWRMIAKNDAALEKQRLDNTAKDAEAERDTLKSVIDIFGSRIERSIDRLADTMENIARVENTRAEVYAKESKERGEINRNQTKILEDLAQIADANNAGLSTIVPLIEGQVVTDLDEIKNATKRIEESMSTDERFTEVLNAIESLKTEIKGLATNAQVATALNKIELMEKKVDTLKQEWERERSKPTPPES